MIPDIGYETTKQLIASSPVATVISAGSSEKVVYLNPKFVQLYGYTLEDIPTVEEWWLLAYPDKNYRTQIKQEWFKRIESAIAKKTEISPMEARVTCKNGSIRWIKAHASSIGELNMVVLEDITVLKNTEILLRESETVAQALLNAPTETAILAELDGTIVALNNAAAEGLGKPIEELVGACAFDFFPPEVVSERKQAAQEVVRNKKAYRFQDQRNGRVFDTNLYPVLDTLGEVVRIAVFSEDITTRVKAEAERNRVIEELNKAVSEIKTLRGMIPICSYCKKIRDDGGYWQRVEDYISSHTEAEFTHGICPNCYEKELKELDKIKKG